MGYSDDDNMVRVDFFTESGKWYTTEAVKWTGPYHGTESGKIVLIHDAFAISLANHFSLGDGTHLENRQGRWRMEEMTAVCLEPHHEYTHPIMVRVADAKKAYYERVCK